MDYKYISQLLERYWRCETTLEEEQILRSFFSQLCVPEELAKYRPLFVYEHTEPKTDRLGDDFDERLLAMTEEPAEVHAQRVRLGQRFAPLFKAAAMVAIVLTLSQAAQLSFQAGEGGQTTAPQQAYTPRPAEGARVAYGDTVRIDTAKKDGIDAIGQQLGQGGAPMLK